MDYSKIKENAWNAYKSKYESEYYNFGVPVNIQQPLLFYRKDLLPDDWKTTWDRNNNDVPDMVENWTDLYKFSKTIRNDSGGSKYGYMKSLNDGYFASGYYFFASTE